MGYFREIVLHFLMQWGPTFFVPRCTFQAVTIPRSTIAVSTSQAYIHRFQPAVTNFTKLYLAVTQPLDLTCHITKSSSLKHTQKSVW